MAQVPRPPSVLVLLGWLDGLRVIEQLGRVHLGLDLLQLGQVLSVVDILGLGPVDRGVGVVDVHGPLRLVEVVSEGLDPAVEEAEPVGRIRPEPHAVVQLVEEEVVAPVGVRGVLVRDLGDGRVLAAVQVDDDEPVPRVGLGLLDPVVCYGLESLLREGLGDQALGIECLDLFGGCVLRWTVSRKKKEKKKKKELPQFWFSKEWGCLPHCTGG